MTKAFLKEKIFTFIMIVMAVAIAIMDLGNGNVSLAALWGIIALLNVVILVRDYRKSKKQADKDRTE